MLLKIVKRIFDKRRSAKTQIAKEKEILSWLEEVCGQQMALHQLTEELLREVSLYLEKKAQELELKWGGAIQFFEAAEKVGEARKEVC